MTQQGVYNTLNKTPQEFQIGEEQLEVRQPLTEFITPPLWACRSVYENTSKRGSKYIRPTVNAGMPGPWYGMENYMDVYGGGMDDAAMDKSVRRKNRKKGSNVVEIKHGNLPEKDYRWFTGDTIPKSLAATCRWCHTTIYGSEDNRKNHLSLHGCAAKLRAVYHYAFRLKNPLCMMCAEPTKEQHWGFPMHPDCQRRWRWVLSNYAPGLRQAVVDAILDDALADELKDAQERYKLLQFWGGHPK